MKLAGFLFLFIIITSVASVKFGNKIMLDLDLDVKLQEINDDPKRFKISIVFALIHNFSIIILVVSPYNLILGVVWTIFRIGESLILCYNEKKYWRLLNIARKYSGTSGAEKRAVIDLGRTILKTKDYRWKFAEILFMIGTVAYSILFVTYGVVPPIIGWFGIVASILFGFGTGIMLVKPNIKVLGFLGGLLTLLFEVVLGGWLLLSSPIIL
jgi:hypothetical protein